MSEVGERCGSSISDNANPACGQLAARCDCLAAGPPAKAILLRLWLGHRALLPGMSGLSVTSRHPRIIRTGNPGYVGGIVARRDFSVERCWMVTAKRQTWARAQLRMRGRTKERGFDRMSSIRQWTERDKQHGKPSYERGQAEKDCKRALQLVTVPIHITPSPRVLNYLPHPTAYYCIQYNPSSATNRVSDGARVEKQHCACSGRGGGNPSVATAWVGPSPSNLQGLVGGASVPPVRKRYRSLARCHLPRRALQRQRAGDAPSSSLAMRRWRSR